MSRIYHSQKLFFDTAYAEGRDVWSRMDDADASKIEELLQRAGRKKLSGLALDLGCGRGRNTIRLAQAGFKVYGIDVVPRALKAARADAKAAGVTRQTRFCLADALELPFVKKSFALALDRGCFHHLVKKDWSKYLRGLRKVLIPGAHFLLTVFSRNSAHLKVKSRDWVVHKGEVGRHLHYDHFFTPESLHEIFSADFIIDKISTRKDGPYQFLYAFMRKR